MEPVGPTGAGAALSSISPGKGEGEAGAGDPGRHQGRPLPPGRLFFALWPDPVTVTGLRNFARTWLARQGPEAATVWRLMQPETLHLTLAFLGQVTGEQTPLLARVMGAVDFPALTFALDRWGWWPHNRILWAGCAQPPPALLALGNGLQVALVDAGFPLEARSFLPHVTLLRGRAGAVPGGGETAGLLPEPLSWTAHELVLVRSAPRAGQAHYEILARQPLGRRAPNREGGTV